MSPSTLRNNSRQQGPTLIAAGLSIVLAALVWPGVPIASAIMLIGCGARVTASAQQDVLGLMSLAVYASLSGLAIAAQTHAALSSPEGHVGIVLMADHFVAGVLLVVLVRTAVRRWNSFPT